MLSNSSKYTINAILYLAIHTSINNKIGVKEIAEALNIPSPFLAKILQILAKKNAISSSKGPGGGFYITEQERNMPLIDIVYHIDGVDKFENCIMGLKKCSNDTPCPMHYAIQPFKEQFLMELEQNTIGNFAERVKRGEAFLFV